MADETTPAPTPAPVSTGDTANNKPVELNAVAKDPKDRPEFNSGEKISAKIEDFLLNLDNSVKQEFLYIISVNIKKIGGSSDKDLNLTKQLRNAQNLRYTQINQILEAETKEYDYIEKAISSEKNLPSDPNISDVFNLLRNPLYQVLSYKNSYNYEIKHNRYFLYQHFDTILSYSDIDLLTKWDRIVRAYTNDPDYFINLVPEDTTTPPFWPDVISTGDNQAILETIKKKESGGKYNARNPNATASGAYQFIDSTWNTTASRAWNDEKAKKAITKGFEDAKIQVPKNENAFLNHVTYKGKAAGYPPGVQDAVADYAVTTILAKNKKSVDKVPLVWYTGNAAGKLSEKLVKANNGLTPQQYQANWMKEYGLQLKKLQNV